MSNISDQFVKNVKSTKQSRQLRFMFIYIYIYIYIYTYLLIPLILHIVDTCTFYVHISFSYNHYSVSNFVLFSCYISFILCRISYCFRAIFHYSVSNFVLFSCHILIFLFCIFRSFRITNIKLPRIYRIPSCKNQ